MLNWLMRILVWWTFVVAAPVWAQSTQPVTAHEVVQPLVLREALVIGRVGQGGRSPLHTDAIEAQIVAGTWRTPKAGDEIALPDGSKRQWEAATAGEDGSLKHDLLRGGGYAFFTFESAVERVMMLDAQGHDFVYINGEIRVGDPYSYGFVQIPVRIRKGVNELLFRVSRGRLSAQLTPPRAAIMFNAADLTLPDVHLGASHIDGSVAIINATNEPISDAWISTANNEQIDSATWCFPPPLSVAKVRFSLRVPANELGQRRIELRLGLGDKDRETVLDRTTITLNVVDPTQRHISAYDSLVDNSLQYYAVVPAQADGKLTENLGLILTLHGADVEATNQAAAYAPKSWAHIVAPTNRRKYGFDWEDWGRIDAMEALNAALDESMALFDSGHSGVDSQRIYLTGHSMGGHGTWHIGATFPDQFAAIAPSAGWVSFWSYGGGKRFDADKPIERMFRRASNPSDTLALSRNYLHHGVYILHGDQDDNVPVEQSRAMKTHLGQFHQDLAYHEQAGAGHWWGNECVDWPPLMEFLRERTNRGLDTDHVEFVTANPGVSAQCRWARIDAQIRPLEFSSIDLRLDIRNGTITGTTSNVGRLALHSHSGKWRVELDGQVLEVQMRWEDAPELWLERGDGGDWRVGASPPAVMKSPHRNGPFKDVFRHQMLYVYGTHGTPEENAWAYNKARYDAETFWCRGNGSIEIWSDVEFDRNKPYRNVILVGNADTNSAWFTLLHRSPVQVRRGKIVIGEREISGEDLAILFVQPQLEYSEADGYGSQRSYAVGVIAGTGLPGMRLTDRLPYFTSGVAFPDLTVFDTSTLERGIGGVRVAGFFGNDWSVDSGEFDWAELPE